MSVEGVHRRAHCTMRRLGRTEFENVDVFDLDDLNEGDGDDMSVSTGGTTGDNENSDNDESLSPARRRVGRRRMNRDVENIGSRLEDFFF
jgi:hypothetical protein